MKCRWFRFRLRTLFVLIALFCVVVGPRLDRARRDRQTLEALGRLSPDAIVFYDYHEITPDGGARIVRGKPGPAWARRLFGDELFTKIEHIHLTGKKEVTDADLRCLEPLLNDLHGLTLQSSSVTEEGARYLSRFRALRRLNLDGSQAIGDAAVKQLSRLPDLRYLNLSRSPVTDASLTDLAQLQRLEHLDVEVTQITVAGVRRLEKALPECEIIYRLGQTLGDYLKRQHELCNRVHHFEGATAVHGIDINEFEVCPFCDADVRRRRRERS